MFSVEVDVSDTILDIKKKIENLLNIPVERQVLSYKAEQDSNTLANNLTLDDYEMKTQKINVEIVTALDMSGSMESF